MSQYAIWYKDDIIENTGYFATLAAAKKFTKKRYGGTPGLSLQAVYPKFIETKHPV